VKDLPAEAGVVLRPARPEDAGFLYAVAANWPESWPRVCRQRLPHPHEVEELLGFGVVDCRIVEVTVNGQTAAMGAVTLFDVDRRSGTVWFDNVGRRGDTAEAARDEATFRLLDDVFTAGTYRKVYARHFGFDAPPFCRLPCPVHEEARLVDQVIHDDFAWDEIISAVYRDEWISRPAP
jgi:hypothetical protein